jgi:hypothetical protein
MNDQFERDVSALHTALVVGFLAAGFLVFREYAMEGIYFVEVLGGQLGWCSGILAAAHRSWVVPTFVVLLAIALIAKEFIAPVKQRMSINAWLVVILAWVFLGGAVVFYEPLRETVQYFHDGIVGGRWPPK